MFVKLRSVLDKQEALHKFREVAQRLGRSPRRNDLRAEFPLYETLMHHFGSIRLARIAARLAAVKRPFRWTEQAIIEELRRVHKTGVRMTCQGLKESGQARLVAVASKRLRGIVRARRLAHIPEPPRLRREPDPWDADRVVAEILERAASGESLASSKVPSRLLAAGIKWCGSWQEAIEAAGFDYDKIRLVRRPYRAEDLLEMVRELARAQPSLRLTEARRLLPSASICRFFVSVDAAIEAAGVAGWPVREAHAVLSRRETLHGLKARHHAGKSLHHTEMHFDDPRVLRAALRHFGTLEQACQAAGVPFQRAHRKKWTKDEVVAALADRRRHGLRMTPAAIRKEDYGLYHAIKILFGYTTDPQVAKKLGLERPAPVRPWDRERVLEELKTEAEWAQRSAQTRGPASLGREPAVMKVHRELADRAYQFFSGLAAARKAAGLPLPKAGISSRLVLARLRALPDRRRPPAELKEAAEIHFGTWRLAIRAAGFPDTPRRRWTENEIHEALRERARAGKPMTTEKLRRDDPALYFAINNNRTIGAHGALLRQYSGDSKKDKAKR